MSYLEKCHGPVFMDDASIVSMMQGNTHLRYSMDYCGYSLVVLWFTGGFFSPLSLIPKNRSKINLKGGLLCGIADRGEILNFGGNLFLVSLHFITVANPYCNFSDVSGQRVSTDLFVLAEIWGPRSSAAVICFNV